ncbi:hypothetical protein RFF05_10430 [Bengtsoniella intestinalis]|uniref:hypothetical protein n=1 Tax=Bengtsoniella intestinalis TaxID=3073143 RepID=UPI00391FC200
MQIEHTKQALAQALLDLMSTKPIEQITVQELATACHIRRQSFYYHFADVYALVDWILTQAKASFSDSWEDFLSWQSYLTALLTHLDAQRSQYQPVVNALGFGYLYRMFQGDVQLFLRKLILHYAPTPPSEQELGFLVYYYNKVVASFLDSFLRQELPYSNRELIAHLDALVSDHARGAMLRYLGDTLD